jgi:ferrous iron transport protein B
MNTPPMTRLKKIALVGNPNTGKSVIFHNLTGTYATVSNYPGTTVEVSRGKGMIEDQDFEVIDTPGMYSLLPLTEDERVARTLLLSERPDIVLQLVDAKNLERMLPMTLQLLEAGLPLVLVLNMADEAEKLGIRIDASNLAGKLGIPVILTTATTGNGMNALQEHIINFSRTESRAWTTKYHHHIESALTTLSQLLTNDYSLALRSIGLLLLQEDPEITALVKAQEPENIDHIMEIITEIQQQYTQPITYLINRRRQWDAKSIVSTAVTVPSATPVRRRERLSRLMMNPISGIPILFLVLYIGLYQFVGVFGAQTLVGLLEEEIFGMHINPFVIELFTNLIPWIAIRELFVGEYGIITLGIRYAIALILPIVGTFFLAFSILEDTGYLPRMALLIDRVFKKIGLNGRAVIPMILGFGCSTMATIVTRTLETRRERVIATFLLALAVPCSAQIGVLLGMLTGNSLAALIWTVMLIGIFLLVGILSARLIPGESPSFYMEIPPLRMPKLSNIVVKTITRIEWYFKEVFPLFIFASLLLWMGQITGVFDILINIIAFPVTWIGLPKEAAIAFLFGFFRRDYGAAGLYDLQQAGILSGIPLVVAAVTLTLFVPCVAQFSITVKERGVKTALAVALFIFPFAFFVGFMLNAILLSLGVQL